MAAAVLCGTGTLFAQQTDTLKLFYKIDERVSARHQRQIDSMCVAENQLIESVTVIGYADYLGSSAYNLKLSRDRAERTKTYLHKILPGLKIDAVAAGEVAGASSSPLPGVPNNRRVDIIIITRQPKPLVLETPATVVVKKDTFITITPTQKIEKLLSLNPGESLDLEELIFQPGRHFLMPQSYPYIGVLLKLLQQNSKLRIQIVGHICCDYTVADGYDWDSKKYGLSEGRAKFLYDYLVKAGIAKSRMSYKGVGSTDPKVYPEETLRDQALNRRVQIVVLSNK